MTLRRIEMCKKCLKSLVANPNVCLNITRKNCDLDKCADCWEKDFICSECKEIFIQHKSELNYLIEYEKATEIRLGEIRSLIVTLSRKMVENELSKED